MWPKLRTARRPVSSRSSRATTSALSRQLATTIRRRASVVAAEDRVGVALEAGEEVAVEDHAVLDDLGQPAPQLAVGRVRRVARIDPDAGRLMEGADDVLGAGMVDADLAADGAVDLGEQGRRAP